MILYKYYKEILMNITLSAFLKWKSSVVSSKRLQILIPRDKEKEVKKLWKIAKAFGIMKNERCWEVLRESLKLYIRERSRSFLRGASAWGTPFYIYFMRISSEWRISSLLTVSVFSRKVAIITLTPFLLASLIAGRMSVSLQKIRILSTNLLRE